MSGPDITGRRGRGLAVGLALTFVLVACGNEGGSAGQDLADSAGATAPEEWSPSRWTPPVAIQPVLTAEAEKEAAYRSALERRAQTLGITDPPRVQRRDWSASPLEVDTRVSACLNEKGWDTSVGPLGGVEYQNIPVAQQGAWSLANYECDARHPLDPSIQQDWNPDQLRVVYAYWDQYYVPCMKAHGYVVDTSERPTLEAWAAAFNTPDRISWWPEYHLDRHVSEEQLAELEKTCPQLPPNDVLYGVTG